MTAPPAALRRLLPGLAAMVAAVAVALLLANLQSTVGALAIALGLGLVARNIGLFPEALRRGTNGPTRPLLRIGIVFLGLQLSLPDVIDLGAAAIGLIVFSVLAGFLFTRWIGLKLGLSRTACILMAAGFSICGASAIAGLQSVVNADDDEVTTSVAMVTLYGSLSMLVLPISAAALGLSDQQLGMWAGLAVHEVAQVVAAASAAGAAALAVATVVKLGRVVLLAPMASAVSWRRRRQTENQDTVKQPQLVPLFVLGFLGMAALRSTGLASPDVLKAASLLTTALLAAAMFGLGASTSLTALARSGGPAILVGALSTAALTLVTLGAVVLIA